MPHTPCSMLNLMLGAPCSMPCALRRLFPGPHIVLAIMLLASAVLWNIEAFAIEKKFQWSTRLTFSETYDDNINLDSDNEKTDWITTIGPGLTLAVLFEETEISLSYDLAFSYYAKYDENNEARHNLQLTGLKGIPIAEHWTLDLEESFVVSEDPLEISEQTASTQRSRDRHYSNTAGPRLNYLFGEEDSLGFGFLHRLYITDDPDSEDSEEFRPGADINYWFNFHHGLSLGYEYVIATFDDSDDFDQHLGNATYTYRFSPRTQSNLYYGYDSVDFDGDKEDYVVHRGGLGFNQQVREHSSWSISGGYFYRKLEGGDNDHGLWGTASFATAFERGSFTLGGTSGYRQQYIEAENLGFSRFYRASLGFDYQLMEKLTTTISGFYQRDEYEDVTPKRDDNTWQGRIALGYSLLPWLSCSFSYQYRKRDSTESDEEYTDNRVALSLVAFYLSEPKPF